MLSLLTSISELSLVLLGDSTSFYFVSRTISEHPYLFSPLLGGYHCTRATPREQLVHIAPLRPWTLTLEHCVFQFVMFNYPVQASLLWPLSSCVYCLFKFNYVQGQYPWLLPLPLTLSITAALSWLHTSLLGSISDDLIVSCVCLTWHSSFVSYRYSLPNHKSQLSSCMQVEALQGRFEMVSCHRYISQITIK